MNDPHSMYQILELIQTIETSKDSIRSWSKQGLYSANAFQSVDIYHVNFNILDSSMYNNICFWSKIP